MAYNFKIVYRKGKENCVADALSRSTFTPTRFPYPNEEEIKEGIKKWQEATQKELVIEMKPNQYHQQQTEEDLEKQLTYKYNIIQKHESPLQEINMHIKAIRTYKRISAAQ